MCSAKMTLYPYQKKHVEQTLKEFETSRSVLLQMPTGTGKTIVFCQIAKIFCEKENKRVLILAHRTELITQIKERLEKVSLFAGTIKSGQILDDTRQVHIASVQTLCRKKKIAFLNNVSLIIVDEAHHTPSQTYLQILNAYQKDQTKLLGVTATPIRLDGKGFEKIFNKLICSYPFKWFIEHNYLSPVKHYASDIIKLDKISIVKNKLGYEDYDEEQTEKYYLNETIMADIVTSYCRFGEKKKALVFAVTIKHAREIAKRYQKAGYDARVISSKIGADERKIRIEEFKTGKIKILVNVDIFSEGFDCPDIEVVQIAKPTKSLVKYLQMAGRVTRTFNGKKYAIILDNSCLWQEHGLVTSEREWSLKGCNTKADDLKNLFFSDGSSGSDAYSKKKLLELDNLDMIEVDSVGLKNDIIFTKRRLEAVRKEFKVTWKTLQQYLEEENFDFNAHLKGDSTDPDKKFVSHKLYDVIDWKFCCNKGIDEVSF